MYEDYDAYIIKQFLYVQYKVSVLEDELAGEERAKRRTRLAVNVMVVLTGGLVVASSFFPPLFILLIPAWMLFGGWVSDREHDTEIKFIESEIDIHREVLNRYSQEIIQRF